MPRYYIDTDDEIFPIRDKIGQEFPDIAAASDLVCRVLPEMAQGKLQCKKPRTFTASIRDGSGVILYVATLTFASVWNEPHVG